MSHPAAEDDYSDLLQAGPGALWVLPDFSCGVTNSAVLEMVLAYSEWACEFVAATFVSFDYTAANAAWHRVVELLAQAFPNPITIAVLTGALTELDYYG